MAYIDNFLFKGNMAFDDIIKLNYSNDDMFISFLDIVREYNNLYKSFKVDLESGMNRLELFKKHKKFVFMYCNFKNSLIYLNDNRNVTTRINEGDNSIFCYSETFTIGYGDFSGDYISLVINLGDNFGINYENSVCYKDNKKIDMNKKSLSKLLATTYINKKYTKKMI